MSKHATIVEIIPTKVWIESDILGARHVVVQHLVDGEQPFTYASFFYNWGYTSNGGTLADSEALAHQLGATDPIEHRFREIKLEPKQ